MAFDLFERLKGIKTPKILKPVAGKFLFKREPEYGKPMVFPVEEKALAEMRAKEIFKPRPYLPEPKVTYPTVTKTKQGYLVGELGRTKLVPYEKVTPTQERVLSEASKATGKELSDIGIAFAIPVSKPFKPIVKKLVKKVVPKERALVPVRGKEFELVGVPTRKGFTPAVRARRELTKEIKERKEEEVLTKVIAERETKEFLATIKKGVIKGLEKEKNQTRKSIGFQRHTKNLSGNTMARLKQDTGITEWKNATQEQLKKVLAGTQKLKTGDKFLTEKQLTGLSDYTKTFDNPRLITQREIMERFKETDEILDGFITKRISNLGFPTVDVKAGHRVITKVVDKADFELRLANKTIRSVNKEFDNLITQAEKASGISIFKRQRIVGEKIFEKMSGVEVKLTSQEQKTVDYLKSYFEKARKDLGLEKYRKNYITQIDKTFLEKLSANKWSLTETINKYKTKEGDIPLDVMLALDDIVGSEKFFRFALQRRGGVDPTTNIRRILQQYSSILENKKALDKILPEGQASLQLLLQNKSAVWMKKFLQNLKGRGLDSNFRRGKMAWAAKIGDSVIDFGYIRLLGLNYMSALKNIVGGEVNSLTFQTFTKYITGKKRFILNPKKAYKIITDAGLLDGSYTDIIRQNIVSKGKRGINLALYGGMEAAEYEIRGSYFLGELTKQEFKTGIVSPEKFRKILDGIAITQGIYTKVDSPLFVQTMLGRSVMQFGRWKITNMNLVRRITKGAKQEWARKEWLGKNTQSLLKMFVLYGMGTYLSYEAGKAGMKRAQKIAEAGTELINLFLNLPEETMRAIQENPMFSTLDATAYTIQELMSYIGLVEEPRKIKFRSGIEDLWLSPIERPKELLGIGEEPTGIDWKEIYEKPKEINWEEIYK